MIYELKGKRRIKFQKVLDPPQIAICLDFKILNIDRIGIVVNRNIEWA